VGVLLAVPATAAASASPAGRPASAISSTPAAEARLAVKVGSSGSAGRAAGGHVKRAASGRTELTAASASSAAETGWASCPDYFLIGSRGSGQAFDDQYDGLGSQLAPFSAGFQQELPAGTTYGYEGNPYPAVAVAPSLSNPDSWMWGIPNAIGAATGLSIGQYASSVQQGVAFLVSNNQVMASGTNSDIGEVQDILETCSNTQILLAGFSQGAQVAGDAYQDLTGADSPLTAAQQARILGVFLLADPRFNGNDSSDMGNFTAGSHGSVREDAIGTTMRLPFNSPKVLSFCQANDPVCGGPWLPSSSGLTPINLNFSYHDYTTSPVSCGVTYAQQAALYFARAAGFAPSSPSSGPQAVLTPNADAEAGLPVTISAAASCDPAGEALTFQWKVNGAVVAGTGDRLTTTFTADSTVSVTVTNASGQTATATSTVDVAAPGVYTGTPEAPTNVVSTPGPGLSATLTWDAPSSGPSAEGYDIYTADGAPLAVVAPGDSNSVTIPSSELPLDVVVVPVNRVGDGTPSATVEMSGPVAVPDSNLNTMFDTYGNQGGAGQWTGSDGTYSVPLPSGQVAWFFSDTFLGTVLPDGTRPEDSPMIRNSAILETGQPGDTATLQTLIGGTASSPTGLVMAPDDGQGTAYGYEAHAGWVNGDEVQVFYIHYSSSDGTGGLNNVPDGTAIATFSLPDLTLQSVTTLPLTASMLWGMSAVTEGGYTYIYGNGNNNVYVARAPEGEVVDTSGSSPTDQWQFWTGSEWSSSESAAQPILVGVSDGLSVEDLNGQYILVTFDNDTAFDPNIVAFTATSPTGPFSGKTYLYTVPSPLPAGETCACFSYLPQLHPEFASSGELVLSYDTDTLNSAENYSYVAIYRPRFIDVAWPVTVGDTTVPDAPSDLSATSGGDGVNLSWTASPTPGVSYWVYAQNLTTGESSASRIISTSGTSATLSNLTNGDSYQFTVTAYDDEGESAPSNSVTATLQLAPPTQAPTDLTATANSDGSITLSWSAVPDAAWYNVEQEDVTAGQSTYGPTAFGPSGTSVTLTGLTVGDEYSFEVAAANNGGTGPYSAPATATVFMTPPSAPTDLTGTANADGTISLTWNVPSSGCGQGCWYLVFSSTDGGSLSGPFLATTNSWTGTYLTVGATYTFYVEATNSGGASLPSNVVSVTSTMAAPSAPTDLTGTANADGTISLTWNVPASGCDWGCYYDVYSSTDGGSLSGPFLATTNSWTATYLTVGATYTFYVEAMNSGGTSPPSNVVSVTSAMAAPSAPTDLSGTANADGTISLTWNVPSSGCEEGCYYNVYFFTNGGSTLSGPFLATTNSWTGTYLTVGATYTFYVEATNSGGASPASNEVSVTSTMAPPSAPIDLSGTANADGSITLSWTPPASGCPCDYDVYSSTDGGTSWSAPHFTTGTSWTGTYLTVGTTYTYEVTALNAGGEGPASNEVSVTSTMAPPTAPIDLSGTANADGSITLSWTPPASGCGCDYYVYSSTDGGSTWSGKYFTTGTTWTADYLTNGTAYTYQVTAVNAGGEGPASNQVTITSYIAPTSAPSNLVATPGDGQVSLTWSAPSGCGCDYYVYYRDEGPDGTDTSASWTSYLDTSTSADVTYLNNGDVYAFYVTADDGTQSAPSETVRAVPEEPVPSAPTGLTLTSNSDGTISFSWNAPGSGCPCWYNVYYRDIGDDDTGSTTAYTSYLDKTTSGDLTYLNNGDYYEIYIVATNSGGDGPSSGAVVAESIIPPPTGLTATDRDNGDIAVSWTAPASDAYYNVYYQDTTTGAAAQSFLDTTASATLTGLNVNDRYAIWVTSLGNNSYESGPSSTVYATSTITPPTLRVASTTYYTVTVSWTTPLPGNAVWVYWRPSGASSWNRFMSFPSNDNDTASFGNLGGLSPDTSYDVKIATSQGSGQSGFSNTVTATTSSNVPAPSGLSAHTIVTSSTFGATNPATWDSIHIGDIYDQCESIAACAVQLTWNTQPDVSSYEVYWADMGSGYEDWNSATAYPDGSSITFTLPGAENGFMAGHQYNIVVYPQVGSYTGTPASILMTYGDFASQGAWGTDCYMDLDSPYGSGDKAIFDWSITCPQSSPGEDDGAYDVMGGGYIIDGTTAGGFSETVCGGSSCSASDSVTLESGNHTYCFGVVEATVGEFDDSSGDNIATIRIESSAAASSEYCVTLSG
jgi:fibronectin type 3 domain-containing protein